MNDAGLDQIGLVEIDACEFQLSEKIGRCFVHCLKPFVLSNETSRH